MLAIGFRTMKQLLYIFIIISFTKILFGQTYYTKIKEKLPHWEQTPYKELKKLESSPKFDTLVIITLLRDCGEFGGHYEYIKCFYNKESLVGCFHQDPAECEYNLKPKNEIYNLYKKGNQLIDSTQLIQFLDYFKSSEHTDMISNAPTEFWIIKNNIIYYRMRHFGHGDVYIAFRDKIFK